MPVTPKTGREKAPRGARDRKIRFVDRLHGYTLHHKTTARITIDKMLLEPLQTLMTVLVIAIALTLPAGLLVAVENIQQLGDSFDNSTQITVFIDRAAKPRAVEHLKQSLEGIKGVASVSYISPQQALDEFKAFSGFGAALKHLDENPLPPVFLVNPKATGQAGLDQVTALIAEIRKLSLVADVLLDMQWLQRLNSILDISRKIVLALSIALGVGVLLVVGNTIRLSIESRRDEIVVVKLVGGTNGYVRRPFLYTGLLYGLLGAVVAWLLLQFCLWWLSGSIENLVSLYQSHFKLTGLGFSGFFWLLAVGASLGLGGAWIAVGKHLRGIEPH